MHVPYSAFNRMYGGCKSVSLVGFTLIELMVAIFIGTIVLTGIYMAFLGGYRTYSSQIMISEAQEHARLALDNISTELRMAGFGITSSQSNPLGGALLSKSFNYGPDGPGCPGSISGPSRLVFVSRNPVYRWGVASASGGALTFTAATGTNFSAGSILYLLDAANSNSALVTTAADCMNCSSVTLQSTPCFYNETTGLSLFTGGKAMLVKFHDYYIDTATMAPDSDHPVLAFWDGTYESSGTRKLRPLANNVVGLYITPLDGSGVPLASPIDPEAIRIMRIVVRTRTERAAPPSGGGAAQVLFREYWVDVRMMNMYSGSRRFDNIF